jgi:LytTr DNA-binding domain
MPLPLPLSLKFQITSLVFKRYSMNKMWQRFFQPQYQAWRLWFSIGISFYYFLFFYFFHPFKEEYVLTNEAEMVHSHAVFALIILFTLINVIVVTPKYFPKYFLPQNFSINNFYFLVGVCFAVTSTLNYFNLFYFFNIDGVFLDFNRYWFKTSLPTLLFTTVPLIIFTLLLFNYVTEKENKELSTQTQLDSSRLEEETPQYKDALQPQIFHFTDTSNKKKFNIPNDKLYYITSAQNYIEIHYKKNEGLARLVLRNSLKALEEDMNLDMHSTLVRCHKAFIINREKVVEVIGPSKSAHFILEDIDDPIPISRQKFAELEPQFHFLYQQV